MALSFDGVKTDKHKSSFQAETQVKITHLSAELIVLNPKLVSCGNGVDPGEKGRKVLQ